MKKSSYLKDVVSRFRTHKLAMIGMWVLIVELLLLIFLPEIMKLQPYEIYSGFGAVPGGEHILGTDNTGRDLFARLIYGGRTSMYVGFFSVLISFAVGVPLGMLAGYYRGPVEAVIMRAADVFLSFPSMVFILVLVSVIGPSITSATVVIGIMGWPGFARQLYGSVLSVREKDYIEGARAIGTKNFAIMFRYILPNAFAPILIAFTFGIASAILQESGLSFLGMGVQVPEASWGNMLYAAQSVSIIATRPWMWVPPGVCLLVTVLSINLFGDGLRDALDPKMKI
ncbi:ABC transporter permease [Murimonas intestini]|uniref:Peptide/nickel transport system permease protein n=1 Tax=Murimonas intestini TaxID=1337051 RepID=A0AB73SZH8_9FIRM|nr:ABC transporter permease [Murimonas intestini]MCR1842813.1 ABC transporter permease [Murimonas intestini]MCR1867848.1 ABC transporter permease [Murimonas intestini]MCR1885199.1 ABC transporter permease [Murimonas intestini]